MTSLLHGRIRTHYLNLSTTSPTRLDDFLQHSNALVTTVDDLVSALYTPQDLNAIQSHLQTLQTVLDGLKLQLQDGGGVEAATAKMAELKVEDKTKTDAQVPNGAPSIDEWFQTCFAQIGKAIDALK
jgi:hypothetical protein